MPIVIQRNSSRGTQYSSNLCKCTNMSWVNDYLKVYQGIQYALIPNIYVQVEVN